MTNVRGPSLDVEWLCTSCHRAADIADGTMPPPPRTRRAKLSWKDARAIRRRAAGETRPALAKEFGVHPNTVQRIVSGRSWREQQ